MAETSDQAVQPAERRRRPSWWAAAAVLVALIALAGWGIVNYLGDRQERREAKWEACAERVVPPDAVSARIRALLDADDKEAAIDRLAREDRGAHRRIEAECGDRP